MAGEKEDGDGALGRLQPLLHLGARQPRHAAVEDEAGGLVQIDLCQKALAIGKAEQLPLVATLQHEAQGIEHGLVIVDQIERGRAGAASQFLGMSVDEGRVSGAARAE